MNVKLLHNAPLSLAVTAIRRCYLSEGKSDSVHHSEAYFELGPKDRALIERVIRDNHLSTLEHLYYCFDIDGLSRAALQELARHRHASLSVQSTRYTLNRIKRPDCCAALDCYNPDDCPLYKEIVLSGNKNIDALNAQTLCNVLQIIKVDDIGNDIAKFGIPESLKTSLIWTVNARSLRNFLSLRSSKRALWEMQELAGKVFAALPEDHQFIFADCMEDV